MTTNSINTPESSSPVSAGDDETRIAAIRARREALHDGTTWSYSRSREPWMGVFQTTGNGYTFPVARVFGGEDEEERHARFIAWAPADIDFLLAALSTATARAERAEEDSKPKPEDEWAEDDGPVLWWKFPVQEPPYCGTPLDSDWPGYHTHWTRLRVPEASA